MRHSFRDGICLGGERRIFRETVRSGFSVRGKRCAANAEADAEANARFDTMTQFTPSEEWPRKVKTRRSLLGCLGGAFTGSIWRGIKGAVANDGIDSFGAVADVPIVPAVEMRTFDDPVGFFSLRIPKRFYVLRRSAKGDLPDAKTGKGRRGSSIFTAGDMAKAEVIAVERFPTASLLLDEGIDASGDLTTFPSIGKPVAVADLLRRRRDRDKVRGSSSQTSNTYVLNDTIRLSDDGKTLEFTLVTDIEVQKPEMLMEQMGVDKLVRVTLARATLESNDGHITACYASALSQDFDGVDGEALRDAVASFSASDQSRSSSS